jgi:2-polyprenyl-6-methoxyphenol hydroxylase-like FAD-dependent oxidoreductase
MTFEVNGEVKSAKADLVVGADGIGVQCGSYLLATT